MINGRFLKDKERSVEAASGGHEKRAEKNQNREKKTQKEKRLDTRNHEIRREGPLRRRRR